MLCTLVIMQCLFWQLSTCFSPFPWPLLTRLAYPRPPFPSTYLGDCQHTHSLGYNFTVETGQMDAHANQPDGLARLQ